MENQKDSWMVFKLNFPPFSCKLSSQIYRAIPVLSACYDSECNDNRKYTCKLQISPESVKFFFLWKKWEIGQGEKHDFTQVTIKQWKEISELASYLMANTFFDVESIYYVLPPLSIMREELTFLPPEALNIYFSEYLTITHLPQCSCPNRHIVALNNIVKRQFSGNKKLLKYTYDYLIDILDICASYYAYNNKLRESLCLNYRYYHYDEKGLAIKREMEKIGEKIYNFACERESFYISVHINNKFLNSRDNEKFVDFMMSVDDQKSLETILSFDEKYIENVAQGKMYNFLQLDSDTKISMFDYICFYNYFSKEEKDLYKCKCDFSIYKKWYNFVNLDSVVAKYIFDSLDRDELLRATGIVKKGMCIKKLESFEQLIEYINKVLAPKTALKNLSSEDKKKLSLEANKKWNETKYKDDKYLKASVQIIKIKTSKK